MFQTFLPIAPKRWVETLAGFRPNVADAARPAGLRPTGRFAKLLRKTPFFFVASQSVRYVMFNAPGENSNDTFTVDTKLLYSKKERAAKSMVAIETV